MNILISNLHEYATAIGQQIAGYRQTIAQVRKIRMYAIPPSIPKRLDLLRFAGYVASVAVADVSAGG